MTRNEAIQFIGSVNWEQTAVVLVMVFAFIGVLKYVNNN